jgi:hypothetical protein
MTRRRRYGVPIQTYGSQKESSAPKEEFCELLDPTDSFA